MCYNGAAIRGSKIMEWEQDQVWIITCWVGYLMIPTLFETFFLFFFFHFLTFLFSKTLSSALRLHYDMLLSLYSVLCACVCYVYYVGLQWNNFFNIICYFSYDSANTRILSQYNLRRCSIYTCPSSDLFYVQ